MFNSSLRGHMVADKPEGLPKEKATHVLCVFASAIMEGEYRLQE